MENAFFISYSDEDKLAATTICETLESEGFSCWLAPRAVMVHASIKASALPLMQASAVRSIRWLWGGADAKGWYVSLSRAREAMHVYTRDKAELRQSAQQADSVAKRMR